jgi:citrate lyase subunit beta/citryl-CoA lyase
VIIPTLESAAGVLAALEIALASRRVWCLSFGAEDYAADTGCEATAEGTETLYARSHVVACSARAGIAPPVDSVFADLEDVDGLATSARNARRLGFQGKAIIHPKQIDPVHAVFTPTSGQIAAARRTIELAEAAAGRGVGAIAHEGRLIDEAMVRRAVSLLALADRLGVGG